MRPQYEVQYQHREEFSIWRTWRGERPICLRSEALAMAGELALDPHAAAVRVVEYTPAVIQQWPAEEKP